MGGRAVIGGEDHFRRHLGSTLHDEIKRVRIQRSCQMLARSELPLQAIAEACGYSQANHFAHAFRQVVGQTPSRYRHTCD
ncbi:MAG: helix-turn-helix transcriptional regulator [Planctomycetota bacterium]